MTIRKLKDAGFGVGLGNSRRVFQHKAKRPGRRPGRVMPERAAAALLLLGSGLGLSFLRSHVNLSILEASQKLAECRRTVASSEREVDRTRVSVERLAAIDHIEPKARKTGFGRPPAEAVMLLAARASAPFPEARPLGLPGAGALGRWLEQAAKSARVPAAAAALDETGRGAGRPLRGASAGERDPRRADQASSLVAAACGLESGEHGGRGSRCELCRALAAGQSIEH
jgi:hypothetical protein